MIRPRFAPLAAIALVGFAAWAPPTAGAQAPDLPRVMPSFNQAYTDGPDAWGLAPLGTAGCPDRIATTGCLVSAFACVLAYYGIDVTVPAIDSWTGRSEVGMNPGILNDWLRSHNGYGRCAEDPVGNCCLEWEFLPEGIDVTFHTNHGESGLSPIASVVIDHALREGHPVIAGVHWGLTCRGGLPKNEDCHWVVLTKKMGSTYAIVDPYNPNAASSSGVRTSLAAGVKGSYVIDRFVVVTPATPKPDAAPAPPAHPSPPTSQSHGASFLVFVLAVAVVLLAVFATEARP
ncbi:MAG: hypothetical protein AB7V19_00675 [Candidatus Bipolaricaulia bacterium]